MDFDLTERAPFPRDVVYAAHRDELLAIAQHIDTVDRVVLRSRAETPSRIEQEHLWHASEKAIPFFARALIRPEMVVWLERTVWADGAAEWLITLPGLGQAVEARGTNTYTETKKSGCDIHIGATFEFRPHLLPGQLSQLPPTMVPMVERVVVGLITPMIKQSGQAVVKHLRATRGG